MSDQKPPCYRHHLFICQGKSCSEKGDPQAARAFFKAKIKEAGLKGVVRACMSSCLDHCDYGPNMIIYPEGKWHTGVTPDQWEEIFKKL